MQSENATLKKKIFIETSVLIAASNHLILEEGEEVRDEFYSESRELLSIITKHFETRIGITTKTVENEAKKVLMSVITSTLEENAPEQEQSFEAKSFHWNRCMAIMDGYLSYLSIEPAPKELTEPLEDEIRKMYRGLTSKRKLNWQLSQEAKNEIEAEIEQKPSVLHAHPDKIKQYKEEQIQIRYEQKLRQNLQLVRLYHNPASKADRQILAEAVLIYRHYSAKDHKFELFLASCDSNNFCPYFSKEYGLSTPVTDEIQHRFQIRCEKPAKLAKMLREELEPPQEEGYEDNNEIYVKEARKEGNDSDKP